MHPFTPIKSILAVVCLPGLLSSICAGEVKWSSRQLCKEFHAEGAAAGDFNKDGKTDVAYGPFWWEGPDFQKQHIIYTPAPIDPRGYSKNFLAYAPDINKDGFADVLVLGFPGEDSYWFENPRSGEGQWARHSILKVTDNESPGWLDVTGDGKPEIVCSSAEYFGYASPGEDPTKEWPFTRISGKAAGGRFTHGLGMGDVNGDKRQDLLEKNGWWEQPADNRTQAEWKFHPVAFSEPGGAQMFASDFDGDGDADVLTSLAAHGYGLAWFEQGKPGEFTRHDIMPEKSGDPAKPVFSQLHAIDMADFNGDGVADFTTGKRWWAHAPGPDGKGGDSGVNDPAVLYWYEVKQGKKSGEATFTAHLINSESGVGTQVTATDLNNDGLPDILVGSKKGAWVHIASREK